MRNNLVDNGKGALIFLVVAGHFLEAPDGWDSPVLRAALTFIYMFHMPAFVFFAGFTAKQDSLLRRIATLAVILVFFQISYLVPLTLVGADEPIQWLQPFWILWFLLSMIWWMLILPVITRLPAALLISVVIALLAGIIPWDGKVLSASRTLVFLPFFVAGTLYGQRIIVALKRTLTVRIAAVALLTSLSVTLYINSIGNEWLYGSFTYDQLRVDVVTGSGIRAAVLLVAAISTAAFLTCLPDRHGALSKIGRHSLAIFLLHGFAVKIWKKIYPHMPMDEGYITLSTSLLLAAIVTVILAAPIFDQAIRKVSSLIVGKFNANAWRGVGRNATN